MSNEKKQLVTHEEAEHLLEMNGISFDCLSHLVSNGGVTNFLVDEDRVLRISLKPVIKRSVLTETIDNIYVPKILMTGTVDLLSEKRYYTLADYIPGQTLHLSLLTLTEEQQKRIGEEMADFLLELHSHQSVTYDIGHYIPVIGCFSGTWKEGHEAYVAYLKKILSSRTMKDSTRRVVDKALDYISTNMESLNHSLGPSKLHNDLHPQNIIIRNGHLAGVIDWECSQYGEGDFDLIHMIHWSYFPPEDGKSYKSLLQSFLKHYFMSRPVENAEERLLVYLVEHELMQLFWNQKTQEKDRISKLKYWLEEGLELAD